MSLLYKKLEDQQKEVTITQENGEVHFEFESEIGKFGCFEPLAGFNITPSELLNALIHYEEKVEREAHQERTKSTMQRLKELILKKIKKETHPTTYL